MNKTQAFSYFEIERKKYLDNARDIMRRKFKITGRPVSTDDVWEECPVPSMFKSVVMGAVFNTDDWEFVDYVKTQRPSSHGRRIARWRYVGNKPVFNINNLPHQK